MAPVFAFLAACCWGTAAVLNRLGLRHIHTTTGTFISMVVSFIFILVVTLIAGLDSLLVVPALAFGWLALQGVLNFVIGRFLNMTSVGMAGASRATPIISISPLFAAVFAFIFLGERPNVYLILGTLSIIGAVALIVSQSLSDAGGKADGRKTTLIGCLAGLGSAIGYGASNVVTREVVTNYTTPLVASTLALMFGTLYLFPMAFRNLSELRNTSVHGIGYIALGGMLQGVGVTLMMTALSRAPVVVATPIGSLNPLVALVLAQIFLKQMEHITPRIIVGTVLAVGGVVLVVLGRNL